MKKIRNLSSGLFIAVAFVFAAPAFADGVSWVNGSVGAGASVANGVGGFSADYQGSAGTTSEGWGWGGGMTQVNAAGGTNGFVLEYGTTTGYASSGASAQEWGGFTSVNSGSVAGSSASVWNGMASSSASAGASGLAQSGGWWW